MTEGVQWDDAVFNSEEAKAAAELAYPIDARMSDTRAREALRRITKYREGTEQPHEVEVMRGIAREALATSSTEATDTAADEGGEG